MSDSFGYEDGDTCWRNGCKGVIAVAPVENCSCHINPPCGSCTTPREFCPECDWRAEDEKQESYTMLAPGLAMQHIGPQPRPLDPRKIDYRIHSHSNASQRCEGVYPEGTTSKEVEAVVRGSFGGRFEHFGGGTFRYIAYTD